METIAITRDAVFNVAEKVVNNTAIQHMARVDRSLGGSRHWGIAVHHTAGHYRAGGVASVRLDTGVLIKRDELFPQPFDVVAHGRRFAGALASWQRGEELIERAV